MLPKDKSAFLSHVRRLLTQNGGQSSALAVQVLRGALAVLAENAYPRLLDLGLLSPDSNAVKRPDIRDFASWLQGAPFLDAAFWLSSAYAQLIPAARRHKQALFFTPPTLSNRLIASLRRQGARLTTARFVDPSCGGSAFLAPVAMQVANELGLAGWGSTHIIAHVERHVGGFELDPFLCELSRAFLNMALYRHVSKAGRLLEPRIALGDSLSTAFSQADEYDVVLCNPPYRKLTAAEFARLPDLYRGLAHGQPNLYALFIDLSLRLTKPGGHVGFLTPAGFFGGRSFGPLRSMVRARTYVAQIDFIEPRVGAFLEVEQETALTVLCKKPRRASPTAVAMTTDGQQFIPLGKHTLPLDATAPWALPRSRHDLTASEAFASPTWRLEDYGYEPKTGFLVPHRMPVRRLRSKGNRLWVCPLIWATQIALDGVHHFRPGHGEHAFLYVDVSNYGRDRVLTTPSVALQRTSSKDQSRRIRCAPINQGFVDAHGGYMGENHVCFILPIAGRRPTVSVEVLAAILNSDPVDRVFRCLSGTATVSVYELRAMPMPDPIVVKKVLTAGLPVDEAVALGYSAELNQSRNRRAA